MSEQEQPMTTLTSDGDISLTDEIVLTYLQDNPEFFNRQPALVEKLRISDIQRGTVSLVERQQQLLRNKVATLEEEITQLMSVANSNEQLFMLYSDLYLRLIDCQSSEELFDCLFKATTELLSLKDMKLWLAAPSKSKHSIIVNNDCSNVLKNRLEDDNFYFGRLQQKEQQAIFDDVCEGSVILIKLTHLDDTLGFLAISSRDADHFDPRMDTLLISQFRKLVAKLIARLTA